jgi:hypothetical protein
MSASLAIGRGLLTRVDLLGMVTSTGIRETYFNRPSNDLKHAT